jgi:prophage antirepressor-like protein
LKNGEPWFVIRDICAVLKMRNSTVTARKLDNNEKEILPKGGSFPILKVPCRGLLIINEIGLYEIILRPIRPGTENFVEWLIHEVLPQLKKNR